jgi:hypothetical protein
MKIVGQVSSKREAKEIESIVRLFVLETRVRKLATQARQEELIYEEEPIGVDFTNAKGKFPTRKLPRL